MKNKAFPTPIIKMVNRIMVDPLSLDPSYLLFNTPTKQAVGDKQVVRELNGDLDVYYILSNINTLEQYIV